MLRKKYYVKVILDLHAVTCPGVWLCTHGYIEVTIKTLGYYFRTGAMEPRFPLLCHDKFTMQGYFNTVNSMEDLERVLAAEETKFTLWQNGRRLAYYHGNLSDFMRPGIPRLTCKHKIDVNLLTKTTKAFPGIISPKIEISAEIRVQERTAMNSAYKNQRHNCKNDSVTPILNAIMERPQNRHSLQSPNGSCCFDYLEEPRRQRTVCHAKCMCGSRSSQVSSSPPCSNNTNVDRSDTNSFKSEHRRLSTCSSFSNNSYSTNASSGCNSSECVDHDTSLTYENYEDHAKHCGICQTYKRIFS